MKRLLFTTLNDHVPWGGSEELWSKTAVLLSSKHKITALVKEWDSIPKQITTMQSKGVNVIYKPNSNANKKKSFIERIMRKIGLSVSKKKHDFSNVENIETYDLALISVGNHVDPKIATFTQYLKSKAIPYVIIVQLATDLRNLHDNLLNLLKEAYLDAKAVCFLSEDNLSKTEMMLGVKLNNTSFINNPFNYNQDYEVLKKEAYYNLACVAALTSFHKGQDLLLKVLAQDKWRLRNVCFNFYGDGINKNQLKSLVELYNLENIVKLKGYEPDESKIWKNNIACIMPSRMEGQSLAMLEAMSYGRMIISTKVGDAERLIVNGKTGFLIDAPTVELIDITLEKAWRQREDWINMGHLSRAHLYSEITSDPVEDFSKKLINLLS